ncbi:MAG TPA: adenine phosphoribosyltransferase [Alphaproteobacteria bacterium]|nr:adenine phosphoribosyltransferase [Alphaproteobacteria bacterium]
MDLKQHIRAIPDFPKPGILFYDISTLLMNGPGWQQAINQLAEQIENNKPDRLLGIESRGLMVAAALAHRLGCGFAMVRKKNKLPGPVISYKYALEYGEDVIEVQADAVTKGQKVVIVDDLLATGGTMSAAVTLARKLGAEVTLAALVIELTSLKGREKLDIPVYSLLQYDT